MRGRRRNSWSVLLVDTMIVFWRSAPRGPQKGPSLESRLPNFGWSGGFLRARPALAGIVVVGIWALAAPSANAALQAGCTQSGVTVTCSYATQGHQASFQVPDGVT